MQIQIGNLKIEIDGVSQGQFSQCLLAAFLSVLPQMLQQLVSCLRTAPPGGGYNPGEEKRC